jgi:hypothetical protein
VVPSQAQLQVPRHLYHDEIERGQLALIMDQIIEACDGQSGRDENAIGSNALKLQLAAAFLRSIKSGERDLDRLKQMAIDSVIERRALGVSRGEGRVLRV